MIKLLNILFMNFDEYIFEWAAIDLYLSLQLDQQFGNYVVLLFCFLFITSRFFSKSIQLCLMMHFIALVHRHKGAQILYINFQPRVFKI